MLHVANARPFGNDLEGRVVWRDGDSQNPRTMGVYLVGIGEKHEYLYPGSTRPDFSTYHDRILLFKTCMNGYAESRNDVITSWVYVFAHRIRDVRDCYPGVISYTFYEYFTLPRGLG